MSRELYASYIKDTFAQLSYIVISYSTQEFPYKLFLYEIKKFSSTRCGIKGGALGMLSLPFFTCKNGSSIWLCFLKELHGTAVLLDLAQKEESF